jgi:hypothetical protein
MGELVQGALDVQDDEQYQTNKSHLGLFLNKIDE